MAGETFLLIEIAPRAGTRHEIAPGTTIGRERCDILLADPEASRRHAAIREVDGEVAVEDLGSRNGILVNGKQIGATRPLAAGDTVQIGATTWRFQISAPAAPVRGDVPAPEVMPSAVRRAPPPSAAAPPVFPDLPQRRIQGSAARRGEAVLASYAVVLFTAVAVIAYFAAR